MSPSAVSQANPVHSRSSRYAETIGDGDQSLRNLFAELAVRQSGRSALAGMLMTDANGLILFHDRRFGQLFNEEPERDFSGRNLIDVLQQHFAEVHWLAAEEVSESVAKPATRARSLFTLPVAELTLRTPDLRILIARSAPLFVSAEFVSADSQPGQIWVLSDITEERRQRDQRNHQLKIRANSQLAGGVAHEVNNALTAVIGHLELARSLTLAPNTDDGRSDRSDLLAIDQNLEAAEQGAWRIHQLVVELMQFGTRAVPVLRQDSPAELVWQSSRELKAQLPAAVEFRVTVDSQLWNARFDGTILGQSLRLIGRCAVNDAAATGGSVELRAGNYVDSSDNSEWVRIAILDRCQRQRGEDCGENYYTHVFEDKTGGTSVFGVAIASTLAEEMGGQLTVTAQPPDGREIAILIPRFRVCGSVELTEDHLPLRVLVVDDDSTVRTVGSSLLELCGHQCLTAAGGREALAILESQQDIDCVLLDELMPGMSGHQLLDQLRLREIAVPVIILSGQLRCSRSLVTPVHNGPLSPGAVIGSLPKPFRLSELQTVLAEVAGLVRR